MVRTSPQDNLFKTSVNFGAAREYRSNWNTLSAIEQGMWRLEALLWSAVEWCEERVAQRRVLYCLQEQHKRGLSALQKASVRAGMNSRLRAGVAFLFLLLAGRR